MEIFFGLIHNIFFFLLIISLLIFIHEMGHYLVARFYKVHVESFSLGFGKEIWGFNDKKNTRWKISILPLGGYVKMLGDKDPASTPNLELISHLTEEEKEKAFYTKPPLQRFFIVLAGPLANFILAIFIMTIMSMQYGKFFTSTEINSVLPEMPAAKAGLKTGDLITAIDGKPVKEFKDIESLVSVYADETKPIIFTILRKKEIINKEVFPVKMTLDDGFGGKIELSRIGITSSISKHSKLSLFEAITDSTRQTYKICYLTLISIKQIILGQRGADQLSGPIKIAKYSGETAKRGASSVFWFMAMISINLGLMNLLPVPLLDGGHLVIYFIEFIFGKPLNQNIQNNLAKIGGILIFGLMIFSTCNDIRTVLFAK